MTRPITTQHARKRTVSEGLALDMIYMMNVILGRELGRPCSRGTRMQFIGWRRVKSLSASAASSNLIAPNLGRLFPGPKFPNPLGWAEGITTRWAVQIRRNRSSRGSSLTAFPMRRKCIIPQPSLTGWEICLWIPAACRAAIPKTRDPFTQSRLIQGAEFPCTNFQPAGLG